MIPTKTGEGAPDQIDSLEEVSKFDYLFIPGVENRLIRYYFYLNTGLGILNNFRNLFLGIFALYFTFHFTDPVLLGILFIVGVIVLTVIGYYNVHRMNKVLEWVGLRFSTHYGIRSYNYNQGTYEELKEIKELLKKLAPRDKESDILT